MRQSHRGILWQRISGQHWSQSLSTATLLVHDFANFMDEGPDRDYAFVQYNWNAHLAAERELANGGLGVH